MPQSERKHTHHEYKPYNKKTMQYATLSHAVDTQKRTKKKNGRDYMLLLWLFLENNRTIKQNKNKLKTNPTRDVNIAHLIVAAKTPVVVVASRTAKLIQDGSHTYHSSGNSESPTICKCTLGASPLLQSRVCQHRSPNHNKDAKHTLMKGQNFFEIASVSTLSAPHAGHP